MDYQFFAVSHDLVKSGIWAELSFKASKVYITLGCLTNRKTNQSWFTNSSLSKYSGISEYKEYSRLKKMLDAC